MLKLIFLLIIPGILAEFLRDNIKRKGIANSLLFSYIMFLLDATLILVFFSGQYEDFLAFLSRRIQTVEDAFLFILLWFVQIMIALSMGILSRIRRYRGIENAFLRITPLQKGVSEATIGFSLIAVILLFTAKDNAENRLVINEVCSRNDKVLMDENGDYRDYIELYNPSRWNLLLNHFQLSDNPDSPDKMELGEIMVPAKGYCIIWIGPSEEENAGFSINAAGETIYLTAAGGKLLDSVTIPPLEANMAYARTTDGAEEWKEEVPSPLAENNDWKKYLDKPVFSAESGFYEEEFLLSIQANEGEEIYYTLDGSIPDENAIRYTEEITVKNISANPNQYRSIQNVVKDWAQNIPSGEPVDKAFIVRAVSIDEYGNTSDVVTKTYFVNMDQYKNGYVLSLVSDPDDLFGDKGIYVTGKAYDDWYQSGQAGSEPSANFEMRGKDYEIETSVALFNNTLLMEQQAGLRIQGASQRLIASKRFSVFARKEYSGSRYFDYELFGDRMHSFFMRPDFEDAFIHSLVTDRNVGTLKSVPAAVFLDGEYWYHTYLREKYSEDFLAFTYNVELDKVRLEECVPEEIYSFLTEHDLSREEDYEQFCKKIDLQSYIDYLATNIYMCNMDASEYKNCRLWKTTVDTGQGYGDGKWRWLIYDMDALSWNNIGYYNAARHDIDSFSQSKQYAGVAYNQEPIYKALRTNEEFCRRFVLTFMDLANNNFAPDVIREKLPAWGIEMTWNDGFFEYRYDSIVPALAKEFELQGTLEEITVSVNEAEAGFVKINTIIPDLSTGSWSGKYYTDYPVTITAVANDGYEFAGWTNGVDMVAEEQFLVQLEEGGCRWEAVFEEKERR